MVLDKACSLWINTLSAILISHSLYFPYPKGILFRSTKSSIFSVVPAYIEVTFSVELFLVDIHTYICCTFLFYLNWQKKWQMAKFCFRCINCHPSLYEIHIHYSVQTVWSFCSIIQRDVRNLPPTTSHTTDEQLSFQTVSNFNSFLRKWKFDIRKSSS